MPRSTATSTASAPLSTSSKRGDLVQQPRAGGAEVFQREAFIQRMMGDEAFAREIAARFVDRLPAMVMEVKDSVRRCCGESMRAAVHKIKGTAANVGGEALSNVARQIEKDETGQELPRLLSELEVQADLLMKTLREWTK